MKKIILSLLFFFAILLFFWGANLTPLEVKASSCSNLGSLSVTYSWAATDWDLDTGTSVFGHKYGWRCGGSDAYVSWSGDNRSSAGSETVTINLTGSKAAGLWSGSFSVGLVAGWYIPAGGNGPATMTISYNDETITYQISPGSQSNGASTSVGTVTVSDAGSNVEVCSNGNCISKTCCSTHQECVPTDQSADFTCSPDGCSKGPFFNNGEPPGMETDTYWCEAGECNFSISVEPIVGDPCGPGALPDGADCANGEWADPSVYSCNGNEIKRKYRQPICVGGHCEPDRFTFEHWGACPGNDPLTPINTKCTVTGMSQQYRRRVCDASVINQVTIDPTVPEGQPGHEIPAGQCSIRLPWIPTNCKNGCVFATDAPANARCGASPVPPNAGVERKFICTQCVGGAGNGAGCNTWEQWQPAIDCGTPQIVKQKYICGAFICEMTAIYPGECFYWPPGSIIVGGCRGPSVSITVIGVNNDQDGDGIPDDQDDDDDGDGIPDDEEDDNGCNAAKQCVAGGGGAACTADADCAGLPNQCNAAKQCVAGGGGAACAANADCAPLASQCNADAKCVPGGGGAACAADADCVPPEPAGCNAAKKCVAGGAGGACTKDDDCDIKPLGCSGDKKCVPGGGGGACVADADCAGATQCNINKQCVPGGGGVNCADDADCLIASQCNANNQCVPGGGGMACNNNADCGGNKGCNINKQCVVGGAGAVCDVDGDCNDAPACNINKQCVAGGGGQNCLINADCFDVGPNQCNVLKQCVPGGGGIACNGNADCGGVDQCNINKQCVLAGGGANCNANADCAGAATQCNILNQCVPGGGGQNCLANADCLNLNTCNFLRQCVLGGGGQNCLVDADCTGITQCNIFKQCVPGGGGAACDQAHGNADCLSLGCSINQRCVIDGGGMACNSDTDCTLPLSCNLNRQCVGGGGGKNCTSNSDCLGPYQCNTNRKCVVEGGRGECNIANGDNDCLIDFSKCQMNAEGTQCECVLDSGLNINECVSASDCLFAVECVKHGECDEATQKCVLKNGPIPDGVIDCKTDNDCAPHHTQCQIGLFGGGCECVLVPTVGLNECTTALDCPDPICVRHSECSGETCVVEDGPISDGVLPCNDDSDCGDNLPPYADNLRVVASDYCSEAATFKWNYKDKELCEGTSNDTEKMYRLQISTNRDFENYPEEIILNKITTISGLGCGAENSYMVDVVSDKIFSTNSCKPNCGYINYGVPYYWRVMVWENVTNKHSSFINYFDQDNSDDSDEDPQTYTYIWKHPSPVVVYGPAAPIDLVRIFPSPGESVLFLDGPSTCFDNSQKSYACQCHNPGQQYDPANPTENLNCATKSQGGTIDLTLDDLNNCYGGECYTWNFNDPNSGVNNPNTLYTMGNVNHMYSQVKASGYMSSLKICDEIGCCTSYENIPVKNKNSQELPVWKEIPSL